MHRQPLMDVHSLWPQDARASRNTGYCWTDPILPVTMTDSRPQSCGRLFCITPHVIPFFANGSQQC